MRTLSKELNPAIEALTWTGTCPGSGELDKTSRLPITGTGFWIPAFILLKGPINDGLLLDALETGAVTIPGLRHTTTPDCPRAS